MALALILVNYLISRRRGYRGLTDTWSGRAIVEAEDPAAAAAELQETIAEVWP